MFRTLDIGDDELTTRITDVLYVSKKFLLFITAWNKINKNYKKLFEKRDQGLKSIGCPQIARGLVYFKQSLACPH